MTPQLVLEITRDGERLFAKGFAQLPQNRPGDPTALPRFELFAEGENSFFATVSEQQITFDTGPDGRATGTKAAATCPACVCPDWRFKPRESTSECDCSAIALQATVC